MGHYRFDQLMTVHEDAIMHLTRYYFAGNVLKDAVTVLDAGCGCGYGSDILSKYTPKVTGIDRGQEAIEEARRRFSGPTFLLSSIEEFWTQFDAVVAFEVLEHLDDLDAGFRLLDMLATKVFIFSVPYKQSPDSNGHKHFMLDENRFPSDTKFFYQTEDGIIYDYMPKKHPPITLIGMRIK